MAYKRRYPIGAEIIPKKGVDFRVWAPDHSQVTLILERKKTQGIPLKRERGGYFACFVPGVEVGDLYSFRLGKSKLQVPDPASRSQPIGVHGPSCVVDPEFAWTDHKWGGVGIEGQIIYEMHIGTYTPEGTFKAALKDLERLVKLGITVIEIMPIGEFPGRFGWGYDGVNLFAPSHLYGTPDDVKVFVNRAHQLGLGVILDVVYNHLGPEGNYLFGFTKQYTNSKYSTLWGDAINFDVPSTREYFLTNARYWMEEYHFDGLRIDATPQIFCDAKEHVLADLTKGAANHKKQTIIIGENEDQDTRLLRPYEEGGYQFDALWNDDFHHAACVRLKGKREAYYADFRGSPQEFVSAAKYGYLYQGQFAPWFKKKRGSPHLNLKNSALVHYLENHDQVANSGHGRRLHQLSDPGNYRAFVCLLLLGPQTPMLFQGQEFASTAPFYYFADHSEDLNKLVREGRKKALAQFPRLASSESSLPDPSDPLTFTRCKLDIKEMESHPEHYKLYRDLIHLRKCDPVFSKMNQLLIDGAVLSQDSFLIRYFGEEDRLLLVNLGPDGNFTPAPEPLLTGDWEILWSSESVGYGGEGTPPLDTSCWSILGHSAIVLKPKRKKR